MNRMGYCSLRGESDKVPSFMFPEIQGVATVQGSCCIVKLALD